MIKTEVYPKNTSGFTPNGVNPQGNPIIQVSVVSVLAIIIMKLKEVHHIGHCVEMKRVIKGRITRHVRLFFP